MCHLYPRFNSCCGIPVRIALIFIAILSIVTGAIINAVLKKTGFNVSSIQDVKKIKNLTIHFEELNDTLLSYRESEDIDLYEDVERKTTSDEPMYTIEIVGEDGKTEILLFETEDQYGRSGESTRELPYSPPRRTTTVPTKTQATTMKMTTAKGPTKIIATTTRSTTLPWEDSIKNKEPFVRAMAYANRNGLNFLAIVFVALGILLLAANFLNSPDLALVYVVLCLANDIAALVLLTGVVTECTKAQDTCLLSRMDWFSGFMVTMFWFLYILVWACFAAVANSFANGGVGNTLE